MDKEDHGCGLCAHWHETDLGMYGICYFSQVDDPPNRITEEDMQCDCGRFEPTE